MSDPLLTPFRRHYEHCRALDWSDQLRECADHLQHPDVLLMEFFESYHLAEGSWSPDHECTEEEEELILEPFHESLELSIDGRDGQRERLVCLSGSMNPVPDGQHPALSRRGLDYVGYRPGPPPHVVLGVAQATKEESPYVLLLRALNCLAELSPPLRVLQLGNELLEGRIAEDTLFDLQLGITEREPSDAFRALLELSRDLAEVFQRQIAGHPQFSGTLGRIECLEIETDGDGEVMTMGRIWQL